MSDEALSHRDRPGITDKKEAQKEAQARSRRLRSDMALVFGTVEGRRVLRHIKEICGFAESKVGGNPALGMDVLQGTFYNASREGVYNELRKWLPQTILKDVEFENLEEVIQ